MLYKLLLAHVAVAAGFNVGLMAKAGPARCAAATMYDAKAYGEYQERMANEAKMKREAYELEVAAEKAAAELKALEKALEADDAKERFELELIDEARAKVDSGLIAEEAAQETIEEEMAVIVETELDIAKLKREAKKAASALAAAQLKQKRGPTKKASKASAPPATVTPGTKETPAQAFERIMAPIYIPPQVRQDRPELVTKFQSAKAPSPAAKAAKAEREMKAKAAKAEREMKAAAKAAAKAVEARKAERMRQYAAALQPSFKAGKAAKKPAARQPVASSRAQRAASKMAPKKVAAAKASKAPAAADGETPSQTFERIVAPFYIPSRAAEARPELKAFQSGKVVPSKKAPAAKKAARARAATKPTIAKKPAAKKPIARTAKKAAAASTTADGETPSQTFERIVAPFYVPSRAAEARPELKALQGKVVPSKKTSKAKAKKAGLFGR